MPAVPTELRGSTDNTSGWRSPQGPCPDVGANLAEEAARAVLKMRRYFVTSLRSFWSIFIAEVLSCRFLFVSKCSDGDDALVALPP